MIDIDKFKTFVFFVANKNGRGTISPGDFNSSTERALYAWTNNQIGNQKQFQAGNPISQTSFEIDQESMDRVRHLKETRSITVSGGRFNLPNGTNIDVNGNIMPDYWRASKIMHKYANGTKTVRRGIEIVKDAEWQVRLDSSIVPPTKRRAIANFNSTYVEIEPSNLITLVTLTYVRNPIAPIWGYTIVNNRPVYDEQNSTNIDAPNSAFNEIAMITLEFMGIHIREQELIQSAAGLESKGV